MGAAAGKQFQSEKAKHAEAVLNAVQVFEESNEQDEDSYRGSISTEFFKKKVRLAASDSKSKGKDIDKSLAQLTDADLDMLAHYAENRKDEERRLAGNTSSTMHVEEIVDDEELNNDKGADNIDETTSVLSYGDDEEEAADQDHDDLDSSDELIENIEEPAESRPRLNSGYKVFPMDAKPADSSPTNINNNSTNGKALALKTPDKGKLKLDDATVRPGIADHFAKFWDYEEVSSVNTHNHLAGADSPLTTLQTSGTSTPNGSSSNTNKNKYQSPKPAFPYKDRGQRIDERNEALMVLQRQKVISLTQNAQLEREVQALQRQLEKMDQIEQTFEKSPSRASSLNNTATSATSSHSHHNSNNNSAQLYPYGPTDFMSSSNGGGGGHQYNHQYGHSGNHSNNSTRGKYGYIYPIDEEISQSTDHADKKLHSHYTNNLHLNMHHHDGGAQHKKAESKSYSNNSITSSSGVVTGGGVSAAHGHSRRVNNNRGRGERGNKHSSPSSSDNDSINSYSKNSGLSNKAQGKYSNNNSNNNAIVRVRSTDPSDLSDEYGSVSSTNAGNNNKSRAHSTHISGAGGGSSSNNNNSALNPLITSTNNTTNTTTSTSGGKGSRRIVRTVQDGGGNGNGGDSDDSSSYRHSGHTGYNPSSHAAVRSGAGRPTNTNTNNNNINNNVNNNEDHKHSDSDAETSLRSKQPLKIQSRRIVGVSVKPSVSPLNTNIPSTSDEPSSKRLSDSDTASAAQDHKHDGGGAHHSSGLAGGTRVAVATGLSNHGTSPKVSRARQLQVLQQQQQQLSHAHGHGGHHAEDAKQVSPLRAAVGQKEDPSQHSLYVHSTHSTQFSSPSGSGVTDPSDKKYRALMDNVSLHLEASTKEQQDTSSSTTSGAGGAGNVVLTASKLPVRNAKGGALKKLNKRRHSMDGLQQGQGHAHLTNNDEYTDTSQDEGTGGAGGAGHGSGGGGGFKKYSQHSAGSGLSAHNKSPPHAHMNVSGVGVGGGVGGGGLGRESSALGRDLGRELGRESHSTHSNHNSVNYVTTDDESVGGHNSHNNNNNSPNRTKNRRPRAKLQVQGSLGPLSVLGREGSSVGGGGAAGSGVTSGVGEQDIYQPSSGNTTNTTNASNTSTTTTTAATAATRHTHGLPSLTPDRHKPASHNTPTHTTPTHSTHSTHSTTHATEAALSEGESSITTTPNPTSTNNTTANTAASNSNGKPKRRSRATAKQKSDANLNTHDTHDSNNIGSTGGEGAPATGPWDSTLDQWWAEISLLLRKPILQEEDMLYTVAAAEAGLMYTEEMNSIAKTLNVLRGALSRWILPYDNNTRIDSQCSTPHSVVENMPEEFRGKLTERQVHYLVAGANGVRKLVRVKIADDNDLEQARKALKSTDMFFKALYHRAHEAHLTPYNLLLLAEKFSYA